MLFISIQLGVIALLLAGIFIKVDQLLVNDQKRASKESL